jgi:hypothetical protein
MAVFNLFIFGDDSTLLNLGFFLRYIRMAFGWKKEKAFYDLV